MPNSGMEDMFRNPLIEKKIQQIFPDKEMSEIIECLEEYGAKSKEKDRVHLAILKLCEEEKLSDPSIYVKAAQADYRDVLAWAEYPHQMKHGPEKDPQISAQLVKKDEEQYKAWLNK